MMAKLKTTTIRAATSPIDLEKEILRHLKSARQCLQMDMMDCAVCSVYTEALTYIMAVPYSGHRQKAKAKKALRQLINSHKVRAAVFVSEAWFRDAKCLNKIIGEGLCVAGRDASHYRVATQKFIRHLDGSFAFDPVDIGNLDEDSSPDGWFNGCKFVA